MRWTYRLTYCLRHPLSEVEGLWYRISRFVRLGVYDWRENNDAADWSALASLIEWQLSEMIPYFENHGMHVGDEKDAKRMRIARHALRRMRADENYDRASFVFPDALKGGHPSAQAWAKMSDDLDKQDMDTFLRQMRFMQHWWN